jgi:lipopolysaccharide export system permease protein
VVYSLDKYKSKTTTYQKIQEVPTINLITCLNNFYLLKNKKTLVDYLQCQEASIDDVKQEIFKRIFKPFYIPLVALICCVVIFISKESINFKRKRFYIFLISFLILTYSEILLKYSGKSIYGFSLFFLMPIIFFIIIYLYTFNLSKNKKESLNA